MSSPFQQKFSGKSPLNQGAYESAADNPVVISNQPAIDAMFNALGEVGAAAVKANADPDNRAKRQEKRVARRDKRADKKAGKEGWTKGVKPLDAITADTKKTFTDRAVYAPETKWELGRDAVIEVKAGDKRKKFDEKTKEIKERSIANRAEGEVNRRRDRATHDKYGRRIMYGDEKDTTENDMFSGFKLDTQNRTIDVPSLEASYNEATGFNKVGKSKYSNFDFLNPPVASETKKPVEKEDEKGNTGGHMGF